MPKLTAHTLAAVAAAVATGCACGAAQARQPDQVRPGEETGLGITGPETPELLKQIKADPYAAPAGPVCEAAPAELAQLDQVLGPDADEPQVEKTGMNGGDLAGKAVRMLIPHRGIIRMVTGADRKEKELTQAAMAASARRGYLKGLMRQAHCGEPEQATTAAHREPSAIDPQLQLAASAPLATPVAPAQPAYAQPEYAPSATDQSAWRDTSNYSGGGAGSPGAVSVSLTTDPYAAAR